MLEDLQKKVEEMQNLRLQAINQVAFIEGRIAQLQELIKSEEVIQNGSS